MTSFSETYLRQVPQGQVATVFAVRRDSFAYLVGFSSSLTIPANPGRLGNRSSRVTVQQYLQPPLGEIPQLKFAVASGSTAPPFPLFWSSMDSFRGFHFKDSTCPSNRRHLTLAARFIASYAANESFDLVEISNLLWFFRGSILRY